jgi:hypothetical protein
MRFTVFMERCFTRSADTPHTLAVIPAGRRGMPTAFNFISERTVKKDHLNYHPKIL